MILAFLPASVVAAPFFLVAALLDAEAVAGAAFPVLASLLFLLAVGPPAGEEGLMFSYPFCPHLSTLH